MTTDNEHSTPNSIKHCASRANDIAADAEMADRHSALLIECIESHGLTISPSQDSNTSTVFVRLAKDDRAGRDHTAKCQANTIAKLAVARALRKFQDALPALVIAEVLAHQKERKATAIEAADALAAELKKEKSDA